MTDAAHWTKPIPTMKSKVTWWKRTGALVVDILIFQLLIVSPFSVTDLQSILKAAIILFTLFFMYLISMQYLIGQTVGMMLFSYRVREASMWQMMLRNLFVFPIFPIVLLWIIDPVWMFMKGERLSEKWSKTSVVVQ